MSFGGLIVAGGFSENTFKRRCGKKLIQGQKSIFLCLFLNIEVYNFSLWSLHF